MGISLSTVPSNSIINFENNVNPPLSCINILGVNITHNLPWRQHISELARSASKKLGVLFRCRAYFSSQQLLRLYVGLIRPCMEYCSHIWGGSPAVSLLDRVESKAIRLINDPSLISSLDSLSLRRKVASLSLFYRYYFGRCSLELASCIPPPLERPRNTRQATHAHRYSISITNSRINRFNNCFLPSTSKFGTLYLNLSFLTCTTYLCLKGRSIITFGGFKLFYGKKIFFLVILFYISYQFLLPFHSLFLFT